jgi:hypothetical protein
MSSNKPQQIRVGDTVRVRVAGRWLSALVVEDRGNLGAGGARLLRVELKRKNEASGREQFEVPAALLEAA